MAGLDDILKSAQWHQSIQKSLGLSPQISEMLKAQESITKSLSGVNMMAEIAKSMQHQKMFANPTLSAIEAMSKSISLQSKFAIPQTTLDAITSINRQHEQLFGNLRSITEALTNRARRKELMEYGMDFETACLVVNKENKRALVNER